MNEFDEAVARRNRELIGQIHKELALSVCAGMAAVEILSCGP
jgi:hypothetical protein